jgi:outer membrane protein OmpA-like peptidoglycan-associated protein
VLSLERFYFDSGSAEVIPEISIVLNKAVKQLKDFPDFIIRIEAHTNSIGSDTANTELSQNRADAIRQYFIENGIAPERIQDAVGYGESQIVNHCVDGVFCLEVLHRQNERYPIVVLNYEQ